MTTAVDAYAYGNCTYYIATRFPRIYPWLGNAAQWIVNAKLQKYPILNKPVADSVVVYGPGHGYSSLGHVAVVESVNGDGSFNVSEMNYNGFNVIDQRRSTMKDVIGFIIPPGSSAKPPQTLSGAASNAVASSACIHNTSILGANICWDGALGIVGIAGGGILMLVGGIIFVSFALKNTAVGRVAEGALGGPAGVLVAASQRASSPKPKPVTPTAESGAAASRERTNVARARLSPSSADVARSGGTSRQYYAAKYKENPPVERAAVEAAPEVAA